MPVPAEYSRATDHFIQFLVDVRDSSGLVSTHQAYTMVQGVLQVFRQRLDIKDAILFAGILPVGLRALFVSDWDTDAPKRPFEDRAIMTKDVQMLRVEHNFAPDTAIRDVARALRRCVDEVAFTRVLSILPEGARKFWEP
jgi:uncharacterized protein (DUF2267 family)